MIPQDCYREIAVFVTEPSDLRSLTLTSKAWKDEAIPFLYRSLSLDMAIGRHRNLIQHLSLSPYLCEKLHMLGVQMGYGSGSIAIESAIKLRDVLSKTKNLRSLALAGGATRSPDLGWLCEEAPFQLHRLSYAIPAEDVGTRAFLESQTSLKRVDWNVQQYWSSTTNKHQSLPDLRWERFPHLTTFTTNNDVVSAKRILLGHSSLRCLTYPSSTGTLPGSYPNMHVLSIQLHRAIHRVPPIDALPFPNLACLGISDIDIRETSWKTAVVVDNVRSLRMLKKLVLGVHRGSSNADMMKRLWEANASLEDIVLSSSGWSMVYKRGDINESVPTIGASGMNDWVDRFIFSS